MSGASYSLGRRTPARPLITSACVHPGASARPVCDTRFRRSTRWLPLRRARPQTHLAGSTRGAAKKDGDDVRGRRPGFYAVAGCRISRRPTGEWHRELTCAGRSVPAPTMVPMHGRRASGRRRQSRPKITTPVPKPITPDASAARSNRPSAPVRPFVRLSPDGTPRRTPGRLAGLRP